jgi:multicomponent Na+:H+ antiporter subunit F
MVEQTPFLHWFLLAVMCVLVAAIFFCLIRAILGPRIADRVVAMNVVGTVVVLMICLLSYFLGEDFLVDVAILYALLNLLVVVILCRVAAVRHEELEEKKKGRSDD